jgi:preprotein translocase subunit Sss1
MKMNTDKLLRKVNRQLELEAGRVSYNRVHKSKKTYSRKKYSKISKINLVD